MADIIHKIGRRVKNERLKRGWNQWELSCQSGVNIMTISRLERGSTMPQLVSLAKLADAFDTTVVELT